MLVDAHGYDCPLESLTGFLINHVAGVNTYRHALQIVVGPQPARLPFRVRQMAVNDQLRDNNRCAVTEDQSQTHRVNMLMQ